MDAHHESAKQFVAHPARRAVARDLSGKFARLVFSTFALAACLGIAAPILRAQCPGTQLPAGSVLIKQGNGMFVAPGAGNEAYSQFPLDLSTYPSGGALIIYVSLGNGQSAASFDLFPGSAVIPTSGRPTGALSVSASPGQYDVRPGTCTTLIYNFSQPQSFILGVTGNWFSPVGSTNTFQFSAYVRLALPSVVLPSQPARLPPAQPSTPPPQQTPAVSQPAPPPTAVLPAPPNAPMLPQPNNAQPTPSAYTQPPQPGIPRPAQPAQPTQPAALQPNQPGATSVEGSLSPGPIFGPPAPATAALRLGPAWVSIFDSPAVPDVGGNSILGGIFSGRGLTGILPHLRVCARPLGAPVAAQVCTGACEPGHQCFNQPFVGRFPSGSTVTVSVHNVDQRGVNYTIVTSDVDLAKCTIAKPCDIEVPNKTAYGEGAKVTIGFDVAACGPRPGQATFAPTPGKTRVFSSGFVAVKTVMQGSQGGKNCLDYGKGHETCNGITIEASMRNQPGQAGATSKRTFTPRFVQFFYREAFGANGQPISITLNASPECKPDPKRPQFCYQSTTDPQHPIWIADAAAAPSPYYSAPDSHFDCDGTTIFDSPTFADTLGGVVAEWRFTGKDFILVNGLVVAVVDWTLDHAANDPQDYTGDYNVNITMVKPAETRLPAPFSQVLQNTSILEPIGPSLAP